MRRVTSTIRKNIKKGMEEETLRKKDPSFAFVDSADNFHKVSISLVGEFLVQSPNQEVKVPLTAFGEAFERIKTLLNFNKPSDKEVAIKVLTQMFVPRPGENSRFLFHWKKSVIRRKVSHPNMDLSSNANWKDFIWEAPVLNGKGVEETLLDIRAIHFPCLHVPPSTLIKTADGLRDLGELRVGTPLLHDSTSLLNLKYLEADSVPFTGRGIITDSRRHYSQHIAPKKPRND